MTNTEILKRIEELEKEYNEVEGSKCEVYSRIVGFITPLAQWHNGKQAEFKDRVMFKIDFGRLKGRHNERA